MDGPTAKQQAVLDFIIAHRKEKGYSPTFREMQQALGYRHPSSLTAVVKALEKKGCVTTDNMKARSVVPTTNQERT